jgi:hypothetical protein
VKHAHSFAIGIPYGNDDIGAPSEALTLLRFGAGLVPLSPLVTGLDAVQNGRLIDAGQRANGTKA